MPERVPGSVVIWGVAAVVVVLAVMRLVDARGEPSAGPVKLERRAGAAGGARASGASGVYVHVAGAVRRPGLFRVAEGARVARAIERAGGPKPRAALTGVNLAARIQDGQQIVVPVAGPAGAGGLAGAAGAGSTAASGIAGGPKPSLGAATLEQLEEIDGIGPTLAERIVEYRQEQGGFGSVEQLGEVEGIGEKRLETLREALQP